MAVPEEWSLLEHLLAPRPGLRLEEEQGAAEGRSVINVKCEASWGSVSVAELGNHVSSSISFRTFRLMLMVVPGPYLAVHT